MSINLYQAPNGRLEETRAGRRKLPAIAAVGLGFAAWLLLPYLGSLFPLSAPVTPTLALCGAATGAVAAALTGFICRGAWPTHVALIAAGAALRILSPGLFGGSPSVEYAARIIARPPFLSLVTAAALMSLAVWLSRRRFAAQRPNNSSKPTPLRGAA